MQKENTKNIDFDKEGYCKERDTYKSLYYAKQAFYNGKHNKGCNTYDVEKRPVVKRTETGEYIIIGETIEKGYEKVFLIG